MGLNVGVGAGAGARVWVRSDHLAGVRVWVWVRVCGCVWV